MSKTHPGAYRPRRAMKTQRRPGFRGWSALVTVCAVLMAMLPNGWLSNAAFTGFNGAAMQAQASLFPSVMSQSVWWLDASHRETLFEDRNCTVPAKTPVGSQVACWVDRRQPTQKVQRTLGLYPGHIGSNANGMPTVKLKAGQRLNGPDLLGGSVNAATVFLVSRENVSSNNMLVSLNGQDTTNRFAVHAPWSNRNFYFDFGNIYGDRVQSSSGLVSVGATALLVGTKDPVSAHNYLRVNGVPFQSSSESTAITTGGLALGDNLALADHDILELVVFATALNDADRASVETYLSQKWAVTLA